MQQEFSNIYISGLPAYKYSHLPRLVMKGLKFYFFYPPMSSFPNIFLQPLKETKIMADMHSTHPNKVSGALSNYLLGQQNSISTLPQ